MSTIRILEHALPGQPAAISVLERTPAELARVAQLAGDVAVFDVSGVASRREAESVLLLSRQAIPDPAQDPKGWGAVMEHVMRVSPVPLPKKGE